MHKARVFSIVLPALLALFFGVRLTAVGAHSDLFPFYTGARIDEPAPGVFLVARRSLEGPVFGRSVVLLLDHDEYGSRGLVINRRMQARLSDVVSGLDNEEADKHRLFLGGPVGTHQIFMLFRNSKPLPDSQHIAADIYFSSDRRVLESMLARLRGVRHVDDTQAVFTSGHVRVRADDADVESLVPAVFDEVSYLTRSGGVGHVKHDDVLFAVRNVGEAVGDVDAEC